MTNCNTDEILQHMRMMEGLKAIREDVPDGSLATKIDGLIAEEEKTINELTERCGAIDNITPTFEHQEFEPDSYGESFEPDLISSLGNIPEV